MEFTLTVEPREERGKKLSSLREAGKLPGVVYGPKEEATPITIDRAAFEKLFHEAGESTVISLTGLDGEKDVLLQEVSFDAKRGGPIHVDFYAIEAGKEVTVNVPLEFEGEAPALKLGGTLTKVLHEIEVTCRPRNLPHSIVVDVSSLETFEDRVLVKDLSISEDVKVENEVEDVVALVQPVVEEEEEPVEQVDMDAVEVEQKGKDEAEGDDTSEAEDSTESEA